MVSKKWKSFVNVERDQLVKLIGEVLGGLDSEYETSHGSPAIMYDGSETVIFDVKFPMKFKMRLINATADPITRFFAGVVGRIHRKPATLIEVYQLGKENEHQVKELMSRLLKRLPDDPWELKDHPMFARSPLLRLRVKKRWMRWID